MIYLRGPSGPRFVCRDSRPGCVLCLRLRSAVDRHVIDRAARDERSVPQQLEDRQQDAWEPLVAVAAVAGRDWPRLACEAALKSTSEAADDDGEQSLDQRLLGDVRTVFDDVAQTFVPTAVLIDHLRKLLPERDEGLVRSVEPGSPEVRALAAVLAERESRWHTAARAGWSPWRGQDPATCADHRWCPARRP